MDYKDLNFKKAVSVLLSFEGGYVNDPDDLGGETKYGISKRSYPNLDIKNLKIDEAIAIYYTDFWLKNRLNLIKSYDISVILLLMFVNLSPTSAGLCVQKSINSIAPTVKEDGIFGVKTIEAINSMPQSHTVDRLRLGLVNFYLNRVRINRTQLKNLEGWIRRAMA